MGQAQELNWAKLAADSGKTVEEVKAEAQAKYELEKALKEAQ